MSSSPALTRAGGCCELCASTDPLIEVLIPDSGNRAASEASVAICHTCMQQMASHEPLDRHYWQCLQSSAWSPEPQVQVLAVRLLRRLGSEAWAQDLLDSLFLEDDVRQWVESEGVDEADQPVKTVDCHGAQLNAGDTVVITKDLDVKGTSFTAKRGTAVRNIALTNNPKHIEGRVNGTRIVLLTDFVKKSQ